MKRLRNILVDTSADSKADSVVGLAADLARQDEAIVKIVSVLDRIPGSGSSVEAGSCDLGGLVQQQKTQLLELAAPLQAQGIRVCTRILYGPPAVAISREVSCDSHDFVITNAQGKQLVSSRLFGTLAQQLFHMCACPVLVVQASEVGPSNVILAAVDVAESNARRIALNTKIMELAISLSHCLENALHVAHAWEIPRTTLASLTDISSHKFESLERTAKTTAALQLTEFLRPWSSIIPQRQVHLVHGPADLAISRLAVQRNVDLTVMGTVGRTGIAGFFHGNTVERVLRQKSCSVLAVHANGFASPAKQRCHVANNSDTLAFPQLRDRSPN